MSSEKSQFPYAHRVTSDKGKKATAAGRWKRKPVNPLFLLKNKRVASKHCECGKRILKDSKHCAKCTREINIMTNPNAKPMKKHAKVPAIKTLRTRGKSLDSFAKYLNDQDSGGG